MRSACGGVYYEVTEMKKHRLSDFIESLKQGKGQEKKLYDPETQYPVIRSSICTGEKVAGFKNKKTGHFTEVMLIRSPKDEQEFKRKYKVDTLKTEY